MFENRVQTKIMGLKSDEVTREWRRLHKQKLYKFYSGDKIRKNEISGSCSMYVGEESYLQYFSGDN